jgi:hypothetical protein
MGGGGSHFVRGHAEKWRKGLARSEGGSVMWASIAQTRWLRAAPIAAGGACLTGAAFAGCEQGRMVACGAAAGCGRE